MHETTFTQVASSITSLTLKVLCIFILCLYFLTCLLFFVVLSTLYILFFWPPQTAAQASINGQYVRHTPFFLFPKYPSSIILFSFQFSSTYVSIILQYQPPFEPTKLLAYLSKPINIHYITLYKFFGLCRARKTHTYLHMHTNMRHVWFDSCYLDFSYISWYILYTSYITYELAGETNNKLN